MTLKFNRVLEVVIQLSAAVHQLLTVH